MNLTIILSLLFHGDRKIATRKIATRMIATRKIPPWKIATRIIATRKIATQENCHPENYHPDNCHPENCHPGKLPPGKFPPMKKKFSVYIFSSVYFFVCCVDDFESNVVTFESKENEDIPLRSRIQICIYCKVHQSLKLKRPCERTTREGGTRVMRCPSRGSKF